MKNGTPEEITLRLASYLTLAVGVISLPAFALFTDGFTPWLYWAGMLIVVFIFTKLLLKYAIEHFIQKRIKLIYKTIHRLKSKEFHEGDLDFSKDIIGGVSEEVEEWARHNRNEIAQLREQEKFRKEFIGNLSHELKTPIFSIQGYLLTLLEGGLEDETINRDYLRRADKNLDRLITLINELESITKLESGGSKPDTKTFSLNPLIEEVIKELEFKARESNIKLEFRDAKTPFKVKADRMKIAQVFSNLIGNSIKYGKHEEGRTRIKLYDMDDRILVEIEDNGIGIAPEHLPRLFERFYRVDKSRARHIAGSGLGLAIVKHIIESHGQTINVQSREGEGSTFSFTLEKG